MNIETRIECIIDVLKESFLKQEVIENTKKMNVMKDMLIVLCQYACQEKSQEKVSMGEKKA